MWSIYTVTLIASLASSISLTWAVRTIALRRRWVSAPSSQRHLHMRAIPRIGGVAIYVAVMSVVGTIALMGRITVPHLLPGRNTLGILAPATLMFLLGLYDDVRPLSARVKFLAQALAATVLYAEGHRVSFLGLFTGRDTLSMVVALALTVFWVLWITNAFNLIDGVDGLAAGSAMFSTLVVFAVSLAFGNSFAAIVTAALAGAILGFLPFNFNPASIFLGDCGSLFIGFLLSALAVDGAPQKTHTLVAVAIPVLAFGFPVLDVCVAIARRFLRAQPLFQADSDHIHHKLLKRGLTQRRAVLVLYGVSAVSALLSLLLLSPFGSKVPVVTLVAATGCFFGLRQLRYSEWFELGRLGERIVNQRQVIANNLRISRAAELVGSCKSVAEICCILTEALRPVGFDGIAFECPQLLRCADALRIPLATSGNGELLYTWRIGGEFDHPWKLTLPISDATGKKCGTLSLLRDSYETPARLDLHIFAVSKFATAVTEALLHVMRNAPTKPHVEQVIAPLLVPVPTQLLPTTPRQVRAFKATASSGD